MEKFSDTVGEHRIKNTYYLLTYLLLTYLLLTTYYLLTTYLLLTYYIKENIMNDTRIMIRNNLLQVICPEKKATKFVIAFYNIDNNIAFLREFKKGDVIALGNNTYYEQISNNELLLEFDLSESSIPYMNIENIADYLLETL